MLGDVMGTVSSLKKSVETAIQDLGTTLRSEMRGQPAPKTVSPPVETEVFVPKDLGVTAGDLRMNATPEDVGDGAALDAAVQNLRKFRGAKKGGE